MWSQRSQQEKKTEGRRNRKHSKCGKKKASLTEQNFSVHLLKTPNQTQSFQLVKTSQQRQSFNCCILETRVWPEMPHVCPWTTFDQFSLQLFGGKTPP